MKSVITASLLAVALHFCPASADEPLKLTSIQLEAVTAGRATKESAHEAATANHTLQRDRKEAREAGIELDPAFVREQRQFVKDIRSVN